MMMQCLIISAYSAYSALSTTQEERTHAPQEVAGRIHVFPAKNPYGIETVLRRIRIVATISLSATGSKKAPNGEEQFCKPDEYLAVVSLLSHYRTDTI